MDERALAPVMMTAALAALDEFTEGIRKAERLYAIHKAMQIDWGDDWRGAEGNEQ